MLATNQPINVDRCICTDCVECASTCFEKVEVTPVAVIDRLEERWEADHSVGDPGYVGAVRRLWFARITATGAVCWVAEYGDCDGAREAEVFAGHQVTEAWDRHRPTPRPRVTESWEDVPF